MPFHPDSGNQTSDLMSESLDGLIVSVTRQKAGRPAAACAATAPPPGGVNAPVATAFADVTVEFGSVSEAARRSHAAADTDGVCACAKVHESRTHATANTVFIDTSPRRATAQTGPKRNG